jgi:hypothetical protein
MTKYDSPVAMGHPLPDHLYLNEAGYLERDWEKLYTELTVEYNMLRAINAELQHKIRELEK